MSDKATEEFEAWFAKTYPLGNLERDTEEVLRKMIAGQAWQASREALVIELPPIWEESPNTALGQACAQIRTADIEAIKAAGLKVAIQ
jgi:hypothetical protein